MRLQNTSDEFNQQHQFRSNVEGDENELENGNQDEEELNCPMIFKTCLVSLVACGLLAFVISFGVEIDNSPYLESRDFSTCGDQSNVRRLLKSYAYEKIILGLLISAVVISFGLTVFMIYLSYNYCQCFSQCVATNSEPSQQASDHMDIGKYEIQLRKRITANILVPKQQLNESYQQSLTENIKKKRQLKQEKQKHAIKHQMRRFKKSREQIEKFNQQYAKYIKDSHSDQIDFECEDCGACVAYCVGCLWCRSCFDAHHYHFYNSKTEEYVYWIAYMIKTFLFGSALAYVIRLYVSLQQVNYCMSDNSKLYAANIQVPMIIGIVTAVIDVFGYIHLFVQGTLLDIVSDTFHEKRKSEHSDDDSDHQSMDNHQKKKAKKYRRSEESYESQKQIVDKQKQDPLKKQHHQEQGKLSSKDNLFKSHKNQRQKQPESKDTDSFFIKIKTIGNRYLDKIEGDADQSRKNQRMKNKKQILTQESSHDSNKKPRIQVPQNFYKLPKKHVTEMQREQPNIQQSLLRQSINVERPKDQKNQKHNENYTSNYNPLKSKSYGQYGNINKNKEEQYEDKINNNENGFLKLSKFSTQF